MIINVFSNGTLKIGAELYRCALGRKGVGVKEKEGDGLTPAGRFSLGPVYYRDDRLKRPKTNLTCIPISENDGWSDDPTDPAYNQPVKLPHPYSHEILFRDDHLYDVLIVMDYNREPTVAGKGSAIFMHVAKSSYEATEGCVALELSDLEAVLEHCDDYTVLEVNLQD